MAAKKNVAPASTPASDKGLTEPKTEVRRWSAAENELFGEKRKILDAAAADANNFLSFLKKQHGIGDDDGWKLGEDCFFRQVAGPPAEPSELPATTPEA